MKKWTLGTILIGIVVISFTLSVIITIGITPNPQLDMTRTAIGEANSTTEYLIRATQSSSHQGMLTVISTGTPMPAMNALPAATMTVASEILEDRNQRSDDAQSEPNQQKRIVIYSATLRIVANDPDFAVDQIGVLAEDLGGWIVNSNVDSRTNNRMYGVINVRVPAEQLEYVVETIKGYGVSVVSEVISGNDVTNQYVDMASRLKNLQASETQLQAIMQSTDNVTDVLATFRELTRIRGEIESIQGQLSYYDESSTFSSVSVNVDPFVPTPTPRVYIEPEWNPSETIASALDELEDTTQNVIDNLIRFAIVGGPFVLILTIIGLIGSRIGWMLWKRRS